MFPQKNFSWNTNSVFQYYIKYKVALDYAVGWITVAQGQLPAQACQTSNNKNDVTYSHIYVTFPGMNALTFVIWKHFLLNTDVGSSSLRSTYFASSRKISWYKRKFSVRWENCTRYGSTANICKSRMIQNNLVFTWKRVRYKFPAYTAGRLTGNLKTLADSWSSRVFIWRL